MRKDTVVVAMERGMYEIVQRERSRAWDMSDECVMGRDNKENYKMREGSTCMDGGYRGIVQRVSLQR